MTEATEVAEVIGMTGAIFATEAIEVTEVAGLA